MFISIDLHVITDYIVNEGDCQMTKSNSFKEQQIAEDILDILTKQISKLKKVKEFGPGEVAYLEKYTKIYATVMSAQEKNQDAFGKMSDEEIDALAGESSD
jgi:hypothetical protein